MLSVIEKALSGQSYDFSDVGKITFRVATHVILKYILEPPHILWILIFT